MVRPVVFISGTPLREQTLGGDFAIAAWKHDIYLSEAYRKWRNSKAGVYQIADNCR
jgi:hypothetical protein